MNFSPVETLLYHYHNVRGTSAFHMHHVTYRSVVITNLRFAHVDDGKMLNGIYFSQMASVLLAKKKGLLWDKLVITLNDSSTTFVSISTEDAASFFCLLLNRVIESLKQQTLDERQRKIIRSMKTVPQPQYVHDPAGHKSSMEYITLSIKKHQRFEYLSGEKLEAHCANLLRKVKLSTHSQLSTSNCILKTNMRFLKIDLGKLLCEHLLSRIIKIDIVPMHFLRFTRFHVHLLNGMVDTIKIGDLRAARYFARTLHNMILSRASDSMEANKKIMNKAHVKFDFDDEDSFYIICGVRGSQTLVLTHQTTLQITHQK